MANFLRLKDNSDFIDNGLTMDQVVEVLKREKEAMADYKKGKLMAKSGKNILKEIND